MSFMGEPDRPPVRVAVSAIDMLTGALAFSGVLSALLERQRSGRGQQVEASLYDSALSMLSWALPQVSATGVLPQRSGSGFDHVAPYGVFEASDDFVYIGVATPAHWRRFCAALSLDELVDDPRFDTPDHRVENREELKLVLGTEFVRRSSEDLVGRLKTAGVPCSKLRTVADVLEDPHAWERGSLRRFESDPDIAVAASPFKLERGMRDDWLEPPDLGAHTTEVLQALNNAADVS
jgi:formyl-CoA transferase